MSERTLEYFRIVPPLGLSLTLSLHIVYSSHPGPAITSEIQPNNLSDGI